MFTFCDVLHNGKQKNISKLSRVHSTDWKSALRPGSKALTGENNLLVIDGNGKRFSTQLRFNVLTIFKCNWYF